MIRPPIEGSPALAPRAPDARVPGLARGPPFRIVTSPLRPTPLGRISDATGATRRAGAGAALVPPPRRPVTVVIPTYGDPALVEQAVAQRAQDHRPQARARRSSSTTARPTRAPARGCGRCAARAVELLRENRGFAGAPTAGSSSAPAATTSWCSTPTWSPERGWLERLQYTAYREPTTSASSGPKLLYPDRRIQSAGSYRNLGAPEWFDHRYRFKDATHREANIDRAGDRRHRRVHVRQARGARRDRRVRRGLRHGLRGHGLVPARLGGRLAHVLRAARRRCCTSSRRRARPSRASASSQSQRCSGSAGARSSTSAPCARPTGACASST